MDAGIPMPALVSSMPMPSFDLWACGMRRWVADVGKELGQWLVGNGALDFQHWTNAVRGSHRAMMAITPGKGLFLHLGTPRINMYFLCILFYNMYHICFSSAG